MYLLLEFASIAGAIILIISFKDDFRHLTSLQKTGIVLISIGVLGSFLLGFIGGFKEGFMDGLN